MQAHKHRKNCDTLW